MKDPKVFDYRLSSLAPASRVNIHQLLANQDERGGDVEGMPVSFLARFRQRM